MNARHHRSVVLIFHVFFHGASAESNGVALTPVLGWNPWNCYANKGDGVTEDIVLDAARAMSDNLRCHLDALFAAPLKQFAVPLRLVADAITCGGPFCWLCAPLRTCSSSMGVVVLSRASRECATLSTQQVALSSTLFTHRSPPAPCSQAWQISGALARTSGLAMSRYWTVR